MLCRVCYEQVVVSDVDTVNRTVCIDPWISFVGRYFIMDKSDIVTVRFRSDVVGRLELPQLQFGQSNLKPYQGHGHGQIES